MIDTGTVILIALCAAVVGFLGGWFVSLRLLLSHLERISKRLEPFL